MKMPPLHGKTGNPYYLYAPDYRDTSSGVCVMHFLCHALNISGQEAYVIGCKVTNPNLRTPVLTDAIIHLHKSLGCAPIAVYPEVLSGNPLDCPVVVRYMLNRDGFISGLHLSAQESDLFFYYAHDFAEGKRQKEMLTLPMIDSSLFAPRPEPVVRRGNYLYLHRFDARQVDYSLLPADTQVLSLSNPRTLPQLAELFQTAQALYSYEISATCTMAMLCGCPVVYLSAGHVKSLPFTEHVGDAGATLFEEPGGLERARNSVGLARQRLLQMEDEFWPQLDHFIQRTQRRAAEHKDATCPPSVHDWLLNRMLTPAQQALVDDRRGAMATTTRLTVVVNDTAGDRQALSCTLESLLLWSASSPLGLRTYIVSEQTPPLDLPSSVQWLSLSPAAAILNQIVEQDDGDWILMLSAGDEILPSGSLRVDLELPTADTCRMLYCDEYYRAKEGSSPIFRPDMNLDYLLSLPVIMARHWFLRRELLLAAGGFDPQLQGALELGIILRLIETGGLDGIGHLDEPLVICDSPEMADNRDELALIQRHLTERGYVHAQIHQEPARHYRIDYGHQQQPSVSLIIPVHNQLDLIQRCVESVLAKTSYAYFELLLVDHASSDPALLEWLEQLVIAGEGMIKVVRDDRPLNLSALYNLAAAQAVGDFIVLLDNDCVIFQEDWLQRLLNHAQRPEVGVVGAKQLNTNGTVAHAGWVLGLNGTAASPGMGQPSNESGYLQCLQVDRNISAVSQACLMIRRDLYLALGGLDESGFALRYADIDLCLRVSAEGLLNVWTPHALVAHEQGKGWVNVMRDPSHQQRIRQDRQTLHDNWLDALTRDPAYNKNLSLRGRGHEFPALHGLTWRPLSWRPLPVLLMHPDRENPERCTAAFQQLLEHGQIDGHICNVLLTPVELNRLHPDVIVFQHVADPQRIHAMAHDYRFSEAFKVLEVLDSPVGDSAWELLRDAIACVDRVVVASAELAAALDGLHGDIQLREWRLPSIWQALPTRTAVNARPRVGCRVTVDTLAIIDSVIRARTTEVDWVLWGQVPAHLASLALEVYSRDLCASPEVLSGLGLNIALHPISSTQSPGDPLAPMRFAACGYAVISNDRRSLYADWPLTFVDDRPDQWLEALDALACSDSAVIEGQRLRAQAEASSFIDADYRATCLSTWLPA
ncbi:glycosyltransferase family 2 protein [Pseudomonas sp. NPDC089758]|uniref:glycosyltransferase family 2 protein n=1 Tax=Pseudomonas sp. NPDC089758 TaxID=3364473 RepID=UPI00380A0879